MTTLQEAAMRKALEALETCSYGDYSAKHVVDPSFDGDAVEAAIESLKAALAQQGEPVCAGCGIPAGDVHMSTCKSGKWPSRVSNGDTAAPAPAQDVPGVGFGNMPTKFLANGTRFKLSFDTRGKVSSLWNFMDELDDRWVALVAAEDDCHLQSAQPVAQPLAKTCDTCAHYQQGKHPGVSIHDETCYECSEYYGSRWEAAHGIREVK